MRSTRPFLAHLALATALAVALGLLLAPLAGARPAWLGPQNVSPPGQDAFSPQVAADPSGTAVAVWNRSNGTNSIVQAARYDAARNRWGAAANLSAAGQNADRPQVAVDRNGNAIAVWRRVGGGRLIIQAARYDAATNTWGAVSNLSALGRSAALPQVGMDPNGNAIAIWEGDDGGFQQRIQAARYDAATNSWGAPADLSAIGRFGGFP